MRFADYTCTEFAEALSSKAAVPGGGGAAALTGAIGIALGSMVCNLTIGKKKYAEYEELLKALLAKAKTLEKEFIGMIDKDAECFLPLSKAYGLRADTEELKREKERVLDAALKQACEIPVQIVKLAYESIKLHGELVDIGSRLAISDVGAGVQCLRSALTGAYLNVMINVHSIKDQAYAEDIKEKTEGYLKDGIKIADEVYKKVEKAISG